MCYNSTRFVFKPSVLDQDCTIRTNTNYFLIKEEGCDHLSTVLLNESYVHVLSVLTVPCTTESSNDCCAFFLFSRIFIQASAARQGGLHEWGWPG